MARTLAMFTDTSLCIGCRACQVACKQWNELPMEQPEWTGGYQNQSHFTDKTYRLVRFIEKPQANGQLQWLLMSDVCKHCAQAGCLDACPTGAIVAPGVIDANRCLAWVLQRPGTIPSELRGAIGDRIYGCDDCQEACPPTVRLGRRHQRPLEPDAVAWVDVLDLLDADDRTLLDRHGRWYIAGRDPRWLRRNALVVLGNTADGDDPRVAATLARYRHSGDPVLAEHATWASDRLGLLVRHGPGGVAAT